MTPTTTFPGDIHPDYSVATVYDAEGRPCDYVGHHAAARSYAARGYRVVVHRADGPYTREELQDAVDREFTQSDFVFGKAS